MASGVQEIVLLIDAMQWYLLCEFCVFSVYGTYLWGVLWELQWCLC